MKRLALLFVAATMAIPGSLFADASALQPVSWKTPDGVILEGLYHAPAESRPVWILLHGLASVKEEWLPLTDRLVPRGDGVLLYDLRGHGKSTQRDSGIEISYKEFQSASDWAVMVDDAGSAVKMLMTQKKIPASRIAIGGASLGANVALAYASRHREVPALLLLSPGMSYAGIESEKPFLKYSPRPLFMAASPQDQYAFASVQRLTSLRTETAFRVAEGPDGQHGVNMFKDPAFLNKVLDWMRQQK